MNLDTLHQTLRTGLKLWLLWLLVPVLITVVVNLVPSVMSGLEPSNLHSRAILHSLYRAALWLIPTSFLIAAYYFTGRGNNRMLQE